MKGDIPVVPAMETHLAAEDLADLVEPVFRVELLALEHGFGQEVCVRNLASLDVGAEDVHGLAKRLADCDSGAEHLDVAADTKLANKHVGVGVGLEEVLDLVGDLE